MLLLADSNTLQLISGMMMMGVGALSVGTLSAVLVGCGESDAQKRKRALAHKTASSKKRSVSVKKGISKSSKSEKSKNGKLKRSDSSVNSKKKKKRGDDDVDKSTKFLLSKSKRASIVTAKQRAGSSSKSKRAVGTSSRRKSRHDLDSSKSLKSARRKSFTVKKSGGVSPTKSSKSSHLKRKQLFAQQQKSTSDSVRSVKSLKKLELLQHMSKKHYLPVFSSELPDVCIDPSQLQFDVKGGQQLITLHNGSNAKRFAVKVKCSDNQLYRVNPVYTLLEPDKSNSFVVYRHNGVPKTDKLVFVIAEIGKDEADPSVAFKNAAVSYPMAVVPLYALPGLPMAVLPALPGVKGLVAANEAPRIIC